MSGPESDPPEALREHATDPLTAEAPLIDLDERRLVEGLRAGDADAFETLVRRNGGRLLAVAQRILANEEDARDAVQEGLLSAVKSLHSFHGDSRISTWLHRIVVNKALMKLRSRRRRPEESIDDLLPTFIEDGHHAAPIASWQETAEGAVYSKEIRAIVRAAIEQLPEGYRTVLVLRDIEGLDTEETAQAMGLTSNAVKIRLHRARQALRTLLDPHFRTDSR